VAVDVGGCAGVDPKSLRQAAVTASTPSGARTRNSRREVMTWTVVNGSMVSRDGAAREGMTIHDHA
jgi:hypothetical protein